MASDSIANSSITPPPSNAKYFNKKNKGNRSAKLKQCKRDARCQQWLSHVKNNECKEEFGSSVGINAPPTHRPDEGKLVFGSLDVRLMNRENDGSTHNFSDSDSCSYSPGRHASSSILVSNSSKTNFTGSSCRSSSSGRSFNSGNASEEEEDGGGLDDWETVADALTDSDDEKKQCNRVLESTWKHEKVAQSNPPREFVNHPKFVNRPEVAECSKPKPRFSRAWKPDDAFRPQSLPNLAKQRSLPIKSDWHCGRGSRAWVPKNVVTAPASCPLCCEDFDLTDSCFLPCSCGFRICLFCHKRIIDEDGRCPGCRKQYESDAAAKGANIGGGLIYQLPCSLSMIIRS